MVKFSSFLEVVADCDAYPQELDPTSLDAIHHPTSFLFGSKIIGQILPHVKEAMQAYNEKQEQPPFVIGVDISFAQDFDSFESRTSAIKAMVDMWRREETFTSLKGWRDELYPVYGDASHERGVVFVMERAAAPLLGILTFGIHLNAYVGVPQQSDFRVWVARRALTKATWPGLLDNCVAGGIAYMNSPDYTVIKECEEEASIPKDIASLACRVSKVSYYMSSKRELEPAIEYIYDLQLSSVVEPIPRDGEVDQFYLWSIDEVERSIYQGEWKPDSALVMIEFMVRHGYITKDNEPSYDQIRSHLYRKLVFPEPDYDDPTPKLG